MEYCDLVNRKFKIAVRNKFSELQKNKNKNKKLKGI